MVSATRNTDISAEKAALRVKMRGVLHSLTREEKAALDDRLLEAATEHRWIKEADTVLLYYSVGDEPDTRRLAERLYAWGTRVALPVCRGDAMVFYEYEGKLVPGAFGIPEPAGRERPSLTARSLCLVPGLAFTRDGKRLGRGGGYYDRFLEEHPSLRTAGYGYRCLLREDLPTEAHDRRVDMVLTEN